MGGWDCQILSVPHQDKICPFPAATNRTTSPIVIPASVAQKSSSPTINIGGLGVEGGLDMALISQGLSGAADKSHLNTCWPHFPPRYFPLLLGWKHTSSRGFSQPNCYSCPHLLLTAKTRIWPETKRMSRNWKPRSLRDST